MMFVPVIRSRALEPVPGHFAVKLKGSMETAVRECKRADRRVTIVDCLKEQFMTSFRRKDWIGLQT